MITKTDLVLISPTLPGIWPRAIQGGTPDAAVDSCGTYDCSWLGVRNGRSIVINPLIFDGKSPAITRGGLVPVGSPIAIILTIVAGYHILSGHYPYKPLINHQLTVN